jgi:hypothetical protein
MNIKNIPYTNFILIFIIQLATLDIPNNQILNAQKPPNITKKLQSKFQSFQLPKFPKYGTPTGRRRGGAGRTECPKKLINMTALVPAFTTATTDESSLETTVSEYPTFWVYVPELPANARFGEFTLQDLDNNENIFQKDFLLSGQAGIISFNLPLKPENSLKIGRKYRWIVTVYCNEKPAISEEYIEVDSYIERVATPNNIKADDYLAYAENNIWYETLTKLAEQHRDRPKDEILTQDWLELLTAVNLADISQAKFIQNYQFE